MSKYLYFVLIIAILVVVLVARYVIIEQVEGPMLIQVMVDPRVELISMVVFLAEANLEIGQADQNPYDYAYKREFLKHFQPYAHHPAVELATKLYPIGFNYDVPMHFILCLGLPPELTPQVEYPQSLYDRLHVEKLGYESDISSKEKILEEFRQKLSQFAQETNFMDFFKAHQGIYHRIEQDVRRALGHIDYAKELEGYFGGRHFDHYVIIPALLITAGYGYGSRLVRGGKSYIYEIIGPMGTKGELPYFGDKDRMWEITFHEFAHSFVNPVTEQYQEEVNRFAGSLLPPIEFWMSIKAYKDWQTVVNEHLIHAFTARMMLKFRSQKEAKEFLLKEEIGGFWYIQPLYELLDEYERNRSRYPSFSDFYPRIIERFAELEGEKYVEELKERYFPSGGEACRILLEQTMEQISDEPTYVELERGEFKFIGDKLQMTMEESFVLQQALDGRLLLSSKVTISFTFMDFKSEVIHKLLLTPDLQPLYYTLNSSEGKPIARVLIQDHTAQLCSTRGPYGMLGRTATSEHDFVVLPNSALSYYSLLHKLVEGKVEAGEIVEFTALIPQVADSMPLKIECLAPVQVHVGKEEFEVQHYLVIMSTPPTLPAQALMKMELYVHEGRVIGLKSGEPPREVWFYRTDLFPQGFEVP